MPPDNTDILNRLFPPAPPHQPRQLRHGGSYGVAVDDEIRNKRGRPTVEERDAISTRWAAVYTLELRGFTHSQIAEALGMSASGVGRIVTDERYLSYRERRLNAMDDEFVAMKPLAFAALKGGLSSQDENTALRASEQWFKGAGYGGFSKSERASTGLTAEDVARALLGGVNVQVNTQVNVNQPKDADE